MSEDATYKTKYLQLSAQHVREIEELEALVEHLRAALSWASGRLMDAGDHESAEQVMQLRGGR